MLCQNFSLDRITKKDAILDETKLDWMNGEYIKAMGASAWVDAVAPFLVEAGLATAEDIAARHSWYEKLYPLVAERMKRLTEAPEKLAFIFAGDSVELDEKSVQKNWECDPLQDTVAELAEKLDLKKKLIFQPIRVAITGSQVSPPLFESIELMDRATVVARLDNSIAKVFGA